MDAFTPQQTTELCSRIGTNKAGTRLDKLFFNSVVTGPILGFGCAIVLSTEASPWFQENAPGLLRTIAALFFPIGLVLIVLTGSDLFTGNVMFMGIAFLHRRIGILDLLRTWIVSFFGNLAGMLFFVAIITGYGGVYDQPVYRETVINFATAKAVTPQWHQIMLRAIGANTCVCLAVFLSVSSREIVSKITAIWWPTATFVALGLDHVVANMYFIPTAIWYGHPQITVGYYIWKSMIPTLIGNIIGGFLVVGLPYWYLYLVGNKVEINFNVGAVQSAISESEGPPVSTGQPQVFQGLAINRNHPDLRLPGSTGSILSAVGKDFGAKKYDKPQKEADEEARSTGSESARD